MSIYNEGFYVSQQDESRKAAEAVLPIVLSLIDVKSVVDVGCGVGTWLSVIDKMGFDKYVGIDGEYVNKSLLHIPENKFIQYDLRDEFTPHQKYDLVMSLEVAEHIKEEEHANYLKTLVNLGDIILFSAAIPGQGGTSHCNEQWLNYWIRKFEAFDYEAFDVIRPKIWNHNDIAFYYRQNMVLFVKKHFDTEAIRNKLVGYQTFQNADLVHPILLEEYVKNPYLKLLKELFEKGKYNIIIGLEEIDNPDVYYYVARAYKELKNYNKAIKYFELYLEKKHTTNYLSTLYHLAEIQYILKEYSKSEILLNKCLQITGDKHFKAKQLLDEISKVKMEEL